MKNKLAMAFFERFIGSLDNVQPVPVSGWRLIEILWPMNAVFRPYLERIRSIEYSPHFEAEADKAIEMFAEDPRAETWNDVSPGAWRVLLERHQQMLTVAQANEMIGNIVTVLPAGIPKEAELPGVMLVLLHGMKLPFPLSDRSRLELPNIPPPESMMLH